MEECQWLKVWGQWKSNENDLENLQRPKCWLIERGKMLSPSPQNYMIKGRLILENGNTEQRFRLKVALHNLKSVIDKKNRRRQLSSDDSLGEKVCFIWNSFVVVLYTDLSKAVESAVWEGYEGLLLVYQHYSTLLIRGR